MSKSRSEEKYESLKAYYKAQAAAKEKELHMDLLAVRHEYVPHHLKRKFLTGLGIFGMVYLAEKLIFGKKLPRIVRFTTSLSATVFAPRLYRLLEDKLLDLGEIEPIEMDMLEDQMPSDQPGTVTPTPRKVTEPSFKEAAGAPTPPAEPPISDQESELPPSSGNVASPPAGKGEMSSDDQADKNKP